MPTLRDLLIGPIHMHTNVLCTDMLGEIVCNIFLAIDLFYCQITSRDSVLHPKLIDCNVSYVS